MGQTNFKERTLSPIWNESFSIPLLHRYATLTLFVFDHDNYKCDDLMGKIEIDLKSHELNLPECEIVAALTTASTTIKACGEIRYSISIQVNLVNL